MAANVSYYQPPSLQVLFINGTSGKENVEARYNGEVGEEGGVLALSSDGKFIGQSVS